MRDGEPGSLLLEHDLGLSVEFAALDRVADDLGFLHQIFKGLVTPLGHIAAARFCTITAQQGVQEVVGVAVVAGPAQHAHLVLAVLHTLAILAPLKALDFGLDTDLGQIRLHQFGDALGVRVVGSLHRHRPDVGAEAASQTGSGQQLLGAFRIESVVLDRVVVRPLGRRNRVLGCHTRAQVDRIHDGLLVDGHVDRLAHAHVVKRLLGGVVGEVANVQTSLLEHLDLGILADCVEIGRIRVRHHMALAFLQLGPAHRGVRRDGKHQVVDLGLAGVVVGECLVADDGVFLVLHQHVGSGADRLLIDFFGRAGLQHGIGVFLGLDAGKFHGPTRQERGFWFVQCHLQRQVIDLLDRLEQFVHAHVAEVGVIGTGDLEVGVAFLPLALDGKDQVIGVHVARRLEVLVAVPLDTLAQEEGVFLAVGRYGPALGQARYHGGATALEVDQATVDLAVGIEGGAGGVDAGVEVFRTAFGTVNQRFGRGRCQRQQRRQGEGAEQGASGRWLAAVT